MAGSRGCGSSLWSGSERVRIGERLNATLAGVLELQLLRCKHLQMVDTALEDRAAEEPRPEEARGAPERGSATTRRQQVSQRVRRGAPHDEIIKYGCGDDGDLPTSRSPGGSLLHSRAADMGPSDVQPAPLARRRVWPSHGAHVLQGRVPGAAPLPQVRRGRAAPLLLPSEEVPLLLPSEEVPILLLPSEEVPVEPSGPLRRCRSSSPLRRCRSSSPLRRCRWSRAALCRVDLRQHKRSICIDRNKQVFQK
ncbi:hypothetical protein EYF80_061469 [Liparis tanakae]|uniref:Uncharacterized protein n=1 Tax=Liparis tanakae TaxID=230148 RepID=A0A4Z2EJ66_9TELE|nr:hypothetical protein EYF80_061469 [Liparis tanakae]